MAAAALRGGGACDFVIVAAFLAYRVCLFRGKQTHVNVNITTPQ